ncbi:unnamed protein product [Protopolystoma xenopodis]|uniref:Uncharacterized protein n=1 Tax=Protopolystoma xenopodis TaxID=117903 RepID=A0A448X0Y4_9PLAT|nr:unnamed protein product [Protopolystoma xenopodis]
MQYEGDLLISGSSDTTVRLWELSSGKCLNVIEHHAEAVLHLRFRGNTLVTCSKVSTKTYYVNHPLTCPLGCFPSIFIFIYL